MYKEDYSNKIVEDIKWFMFDDETKTIENECGFSHDLNFVTWVGDGHCFIIADHNGIEYRVCVTKEME